MSKRSRYPVDVLRAADTRAFLSAAGKNNILRLHVVDVGQGLAVIVQTRHQLFFMTRVRTLNADFNIGSVVVVPALRWLGIRALDVVVISHGDNDHVGGLLGIESIYPNKKADK